MKTELGKQEGWIPEEPLTQEEIENHLAMTIIELDRFKEATIECLEVITKSYSERFEFITTELLKHEVDRRHDINEYLKRSMSAKWKEIYEKFEDVYSRLKQNRIKKYD